uniref:Uncharacterized protein n=1 Tax=Corethron hystrix TaxID=216773 RepID=A0A6U5EN43_9STRA|mmetsp:Transcript_18312/g.41898  ORF Transcript_18312/g.41898 Transcript_18312/m.41898 type:complete len:134 (+) Transcript_18312:221-622(+)
MNFPTVKENMKGTVSMRKLLEILNYKKNWSHYLTEGDEWKFMRNKAEHSMTLLYNRVKDICNALCTEHHKNVRGVNEEMKGLKKELMAKKSEANSLLMGEFKSPTPRVRGEGGEEEETPRRIRDVPQEGEDQV